MSLKTTVSEILDILEPASKLTESQKKRLRILQRKFDYQLEGQDKHVKECDELLDALKECDDHKRRVEETAGDLLETCRQLDVSQAEHEKTKVRLADAERLLIECSLEYNELQDTLSKLTELLTEKTYEQDFIPPCFSE